MNRFKLVSGHRYIMEDLKDFKDGNLRDAWVAVPMRTLAEYNTLHDITREIFSYVRLHNYSFWTVIFEQLLNYDFVDTYGDMMSDQERLEFIHLMLKRLSLNNEFFRDVFCWFESDVLIVTNVSKDINRSLKHLRLNQDDVFTDSLIVANEEDLALILLLCSQNTHNILDLKKLRNLDPTWILSVNGSHN